MTDPRPSPVAVVVETTPKKVFVAALEWPGWCRSGRDADAAFEAFAQAAPRYRRVVESTGRPLPDDGRATEVVERIEGDSGTAFGVPSRIAERDRAPTDAAQAERLAALVAAAWAEFDRVAASAPAELRKGPRGGGRDTVRIVEHVTGADQAYAGVMGLKLRAPAPGDTVAVAAMRSAMLDVLRRPSDGSPLAGKKWPPRYAARRIAWHALDHAWEIEDRSDPPS